MPTKTEIYRGSAWLIDTYDGCCVVPDDLVTVQPFDGDADSELYSRWLSDAIAQFEQYCDGPIIDIPDYPIGGWLGRVVISEHIAGRWGIYESASEAEADLVGPMP